MEPKPHVPSTPWTDDCGCDDLDFCFSHRNGLRDDWPKKPSEEEMLERAKRRSEILHAGWVKLVEKFRRVKATMRAWDRMQKHIEDLLEDISDNQLGSLPSAVQVREVLNQYIEDLNNENLLDD